MIFHPPDNGIEPLSTRVALEPVVAALSNAGFYAYITLDHANRWSVACDTEAGRVDVRLGTDGYLLEVWDTSPGLFWDEEDEHRREAKERLARVTLPGIARGFLETSQSIWWDDDEHGVGARIQVELSFAARERIGLIVQQQLERLNDLLVLVETRLIN